MGALDDLGLLNRDGPGSFYAGSAVLNLRAVDRGQKVLAEFHEKQPSTRAILAGVLHSSVAARPNLEIRTPGTKGRSSDGERRIASNVRRWDDRDVILLDPFAMWRQPKHQKSRDLYSQILDAAVDRRCPLSLFFTWGNANEQAIKDLTEERRVPRNGYADLLAGLRERQAIGVKVEWVWKHRFAMWLLLPDLDLRDAILARLPTELAPIDGLAALPPITRKYPETLVTAL